MEDLSATSYAIDGSRLSLSIGLSLGRLDEMLRRPPLLLATEAWFIRTEALRIAAREGHGTDEIRLAGYANEAGHEIPDQSVRTAADISAALRIVLGWKDIASPGEADIREVWEMSERSNLGRSAPETLFKLEQAYTSVARTLDVMLTDPSPEKTINAFISILRTEAFTRRGARMALLLTPYLIRRGFQTPRAPVGLAKHIFQDGLHLDQGFEDLVAVFLTALASGARDSLDGASKLSRLESDLTTMAAPKRSSSYVSAAVRSLLAWPVTNAARLSQALDVTHKGAINILERLETAGCIARLPGPEKNRSYVCHKALNI